MNESNIIYEGTVVESPCGGWPLK